MTSCRTSCIVFALALIANVALAAPSVASAAQSGPLEGVPLVFSCDVNLDLYHPLLRDYAGRDLYDFITEPIIDPVAVLSEWLCGRVWSGLAQAGAHHPPAGIKLPAVASLHVELISAVLTSERIAQEFFGRELSFTPVPHWAVDLLWTMEFALIDGSGRPNHSLRGELSGGASHGDYVGLQMDSLLAKAIDRSFASLPERLVEEGGLGNLFFAPVDRPIETPGPLEAPSGLDSSFGLLLGSDVEVRHAAMAILLSCQRLNPAARSDLARWFLLNDPDVVLRQDALTWLLSPSSEQNLSLETTQVSLLRWVLQADRSWRMKSRVVEMISQREGDATLTLLLLASMDPDIRVSDLANTKLRRLPPAVPAEMDEALRTALRPTLPTWTAALDGRVTSQPGSDLRQLVSMAEASASEVGVRWLSRWLSQQSSPGSDDHWVWDAWTRLAAHSSPELRAACLARFAAEMRHVRTGALVVERIYNEPLASLRARAIGLLDHPAIPGALGAVLEASRSPSAEVRRTSAGALAMMSDRESAKRLEALVEDADRKVRRAAKKSLRKRKRAAQKRR
jgi:hypothetical protein